MANNNGKKDLEEQSKKPSVDVKEGKNNEELKKDRMTATTKMVHYQVRHTKIL